MNLKDIYFNKGMYALLKENGRLDCNDGKDSYKGWKEICELMGYSSGRTPAYEAYMDGYYSGTPPKKETK